MMIKNIYLVFIFVFLFSSYGAGADQGLLDRASDEPLKITSDRLEAFNEKKLVVFSGNAKVTQGNHVLKSDKLLLYYKDLSGHQEKKNKIGSEQSGELEKIEARGNVTLIQKDRNVTSDEAIYFRDTNKIVLTGNAVLNEGKNSIKGDRVTIFLNDNKGMVESDHQHQVKAIIYPEQKSPLEKK